MILVPILVALLVIIVLLGYVKAPPDTAFIISGLRRRVLIGEAGVKIPFLERMDRIYLGQMTVDIKTGSSVPTNDFINVNVDAVAKVRVNTENGGIDLAARNFLNMNTNEIASELIDTLQGNMREIIGTLTLKEINTDRDSFSDQVLLKASKDMEKLGIEILSCNIQNVTDDNGLIADLGADNTAVIKRNASIAKAQADRDVKIAQAEADKQANDARIASETEIAEKNNLLEIKKAELKIEADAKKAQADAVYEIQNQEQQKAIQQTTVEAQIVRAEKEAELKNKEVEIRKQQLDAEIKAQADAERYKKEQEAQANLFERQKKAEAELYEKQREAEAEKAKADGIRAKGLAEAEALEAKALAEAKGIDSKAEAMKKYGEAAIVEMLVQVLPDIAKNVAEPLSKVDKITMYGDGNNTKLLKDIVNGTNQVTEGMFEGIGLDLKTILAGFLGGKASSHSGSIVKNQLEIGELIESIQKTTEE